MASDDNFDLDSFNFDDMDFGGLDDLVPEKVPNDRKPAARLTTSFISGVKNSAKDPSLIEKFVTRALPEEYEKAVDLGGEAVDTARSLYNTATKELAPSIRAAKKAARSALPEENKFLPKKLYDRLKSLLEEKDESSSNRDYKAESNEYEIATAIGDIFTTHMDKQEERRSGMDIVKDSVSAERHESEFSQLVATRTGIERLVGYQDNVTAKYQSKSIELQYRQLYVTQDTLEVLKATSRDQTSRLDAVVKNTGLPESQKIRLNEAFGQSGRDRLIGGVFNSVENVTGGMKERFVNNLRSKIKEGASNLNLASQLGGAVGGRGGLDDLGESAGGMFGGQIAMELAAKLNAQLERSPKLREQAARAGYFMDNAEELTGEWADTRSGSDERFSGVKNFLKGMIPSMGMVDDFDENLSENAHQPTHLSVLMGKSITDTIPDYLSRILVSVEKIAGNPNAERRVFDPISNRMISERGRASNTDHQLFNDGIVGDVGYAADSLMDVLAISDLSGEAYNGIRKQFLFDAFTGKTFTLQRYSNPDNYTKITDPQIVGEVVSHMTSLGRLLTEGRPEEKADAQVKVRRLANEFKRLRSAAGDPRKAMANLGGLGRLDDLRDMGLVKTKDGKDSVDYDAYLDRLMSKQGPSTPKDYSQGESGGPNGGPSGGVFVRGEIRPRMTPEKFAAGEYSDVKSGKPIVTTRDIRGAVQDAEGKEVISDAEYKAGLVDGNGRPITTGSFAADLMGKVKGSTAYTRASEFGSSVTDLFVKGRKTPSLTKAKLLAGEYYDAATGTVLTSFSDIKGAVIDRAGNAVVSLEDLREGLVDNAGKLVPTLPTFESLNALRDKAPTFTDLRAGVDGLVQRARDTITDLYVKGRDLPSLTKAKLLAGEYYDAASGSVLTTFDAIKGPVIDRYGDVVLGLEDIQVGVIDRYGQSIATLQTTDLRQHAPTRASFATQVMGMQSQVSNQVTDLYVKGKVNPTLTRAKLLAGEYYDAATGRVLETFNDLKGPVTDRMGNVVLSLEDVKLGLVNRLGQSLTSLSFKLPTLPTRANIVTAVTDFAKKLLHSDEKDDVYVSGDDTPRLLYYKLIAGEYLDATSGKVLESFHDIKGPVMDKVGNVLLEVGDFKRGFVSRAGKKLRWAVGLYAKYLKWTFGLPLRALSAGVDFIKGKLPGRMNPQLATTVGIEPNITPLTSESGHIKEFMTLIRSIKSEGKDDKPKDARDGDGDGLRDGSWQEQFANRKDKEDDQPEEGEKEKEKSKSLFDVIAGGLGSLFDRFNPFGGDGDIDVDLGGGGDRSRRRRRRGGRGRGLGSKLWKGTKALGRGTAFLGRGLLSGGGAVIRGGAMLGTALAGVVSAPVLIGAAVVGAVALGGWMAYKHFAKKKDPLYRFRMVQYGISSDSDAAAKVIALEKLLEPALKWEGENPDLDPNKVDESKMIAIFDLDENKEEAFNDWALWFTDRFKPVYLAWRRAHMDVASKVDFFDLDGALTPPQKNALFRAVLVTEENEEMFHTPAPTTLQKKPITVADIRNVEKEVRKHIEGELKKHEKKIPTANVDTASVTTLATLATLKPKTSGLSTLPKGSFPSQTSLGSGSASNFMMLGSAMMASGHRIGKLDAVHAVRMRTYGLDELTEERVATLMRLEEKVYDDIAFNSDRVAVFNGEVEVYFTKYALQFGIMTEDEEQRYDWIQWFKLRFIPTLLTYLTAVRSEHPTIDPLIGIVGTLSPEHRLRIAMATVATMSEDEAVWRIQNSPFPGLVMNDDPSTTEANLEAIRKDVKTPTVTEDRAVGSAVGATPVVKPQSSRSDFTNFAQKRNSQSGGYSNFSAMSPGSGSPPPTVEGGSPYDKYSQQMGPMRAGSGGEIDTANVSVNAGNDKGVKTPRKMAEKLIIREMIKQGFSDPRHIAMILAQARKESGDFSTTTENMNYGTKNVPWMVSNFREIRSKEQALNLVRQGPAAIANTVYGGSKGRELGNSKPTDGWDMRGRGWLQTTGRSNYAQVSQQTGVDFVNNPRLMSDDPNALAMAAVNYYKNNARMQSIAEGKPFSYAGKGINPSRTPDMEGREKFYRDYLQQLTSGTLTADTDEFKVAANDSGKDVKEVSEGVQGDIPTTGLESATIAATNEQSTGSSSVTTPSTPDASTPTTSTTPPPLLSRVSHTPNVSNVAAGPTSPAMGKGFATAPVSAPVKTSLPMQQAAMQRSAMETETQSKHVQTMSNVQFDDIVSVLKQSHGVLTNMDKSLEVIRNAFTTPPGKSSQSPAQPQQASGRQPTEIGTFKSPVSLKRQA